MRSCIHWASNTYFSEYNQNLSLSGATHEQNREDRDEYVRIVEDQIIEESKKNFEKKDALFSSYGTPYDYDSVMHYDEDAFSMSGTKTIVPIIANITLRQVICIAHYDILYHVQTCEK